MDTIGTKSKSVVKGADNGLLAEPQPVVRKQGRDGRPQAAAPRGAQLALAQYEVRDGEEVRSFLGEVGIADLARRIEAGEFTADTKARYRPAGTAFDRDKGWTALSEVAVHQTALRLMFHPVWTRTLQGLGYGVLIGIILKSLDTTALFFSMDSGLGAMWLLVLGSILVSRWISFAPMIVAFLMFKSGFGANLFITLLAVMFVGALFGGPAGMIIGTLVGYLRRGSVRVASHAQSEGSRPLYLGIIAPAVGLAIALAIYLMWFMPMAMDYLSE